MRIFEGYQHGVNLGGWLSQCGQPDQHHIDRFIARKDLEDIARLGLDHVRLPVDYFFLENDDGTPLEIGIKAIDRCLDWCEALGLNLVLDLHKAYGYTFDPMDRNADRTAFFYSDPLQERFCALWQRLAARYGQSPRVAFELLNEVVAPEVAQPWNKAALRAIRAIRAKTIRTPVIVGGTRYNHAMSVPELAVRADEGIVYNFHCYEPLVFTHQGAYWVSNMPADFRLDYPGDPEKYLAAAQTLDPHLAAGSVPAVMGPDFFENLFAPAISHAEKEDVPLYCGEYGVIDRADPAASLRWFEDITAVFRRHGIGRALWSYREMDFGLTDAHYAPIRERLIRLMTDNA